MEHMENKYYLLSVKELCEDNGDERLSREVLDRVDKDRREKAVHMRARAGRAASLGAGLLLQMAVQGALKEGTDREEAENRGTEGKKIRILVEGVGPAGGKRQDRATEGNLAVYTVSQALKLLEEPLDLKFRYGPNGKPYLQDHPFYFNLSHSGEYVFCAISDREVGVDIQQYRPVDESRLARRFFSVEEQKALTRCLDSEERRKLFYRLWTRKEAYGKLTGEGITASMGRNVLPADELLTLDMPLLSQLRVEKLRTEKADMKSLFWQEWILEGYSIALCQYKVC